MNNTLAEERSKYEAAIKNLEEQNRVSVRVNLEENIIISIISRCADIAGKMFHLDNFHHFPCRLWLNQ